MWLGVDAVFSRAHNICVATTHHVEIVCASAILLQSLETDLLVEHITRLKGGEAVDLPTYNFCTHTRESTTVRQEPRPVILIEGKFYGTE